MFDPPTTDTPRVPASEFDTQKVEKKLRLMAGLFDMAFQVKHAQLKSKHPELSERELNHLVYALIEKGCR
jgi:hypothetical protein